MISHIELYIPKIREFINKNYKYVLLVIFIVFLFRIIGLDKDFPNFGLTYYQTKDEGQYSMIALNLFNYGTLSDTGDFLIRISPTFRSNIIIGFLQFLSMNLLGDNYYGFRIMYTISSICTFALIYQILKILLADYKERKILIILILLFILLDFSFLTMSRIVENSSIRALTTAGAIYLYLIIKDERLRYFLITSLGIFSIFMIYFSNFHIILACCLLLFVNFLKKDWQKCKTMLIYGGLGIICSVIICEIFYLVIWGQGSWRTLFESIFSFSDRIGPAGEQQSFITTLAKGVFTFFSSNMFFYNFGLSLITFFGLIINGFIAFKKNDEKQLYIIFLIVAIILQSMLTNDWMERKSICVYPAIISNMVILFLNRKVIKCSKRKSVFVLSSCLLMFYTMTRLHVSRKYFMDFETLDIYIWVILTVAQIIVITSFSLKHTLRKGMFVVISMMLINGYYSLKYVFFFDNYSEKNAMVQIGNVVNDEYAIGPYAYGYTLYNEMKPIWNTIEVCREYLNSDKLRYMVDYFEGPYYVIQMSNERPYKVIDSFQRNLQAQGKLYPIGVFEKEWEQ